jgi:hypothetical protein
MYDKELKEAILACTDFIKRACEELDPKNPEAVMAAVEAYKALSEIELRAIMASEELKARRNKAKTAPKIAVVS